MPWLPSWLSIPKLPKSKLLYVPMRCFYVSLFKVVLLKPTPSAFLTFAFLHPILRFKTNKRLLTLKNILDKYLEMKAREEQMEHLIKELSETNAVLVKLVNHLQTPAPVAAPDVSHQMTSSSDSQLIHSGYLDSRSSAAPIASSAEFSASYISSTSSHPNTHTNGHHSGHTTRMELQEELPQAEFMESAYRQLLEDPSFAASLAQQLNTVRGDRTRTGDSVTSNNDSVYEQVLESDTIGNILDQLIPPYQAGTPAAMEDGYADDAYSNDSRMSQSVQTPHTPHTPYAVAPNASSSAAPVIDDLQLMYPEVASFDAEESNAGSSFSGLGRSTAIPMSYFEQHPNGLELLQSQPTGAGSAPVLTSLAQGTKSSSLLGTSTTLPGFNIKTVPSSRPKTPGTAETSRISPTQKTKKRTSASPEGLTPKRKKDR